MKTVAVVLAAGSGSRMQSDVKKQYMEIGGKPLIYYSLKAAGGRPVSRAVQPIQPGHVVAADRFGDADAVYDA